MVTLVDILDEAEFKAALLPWKTNLVLYPDHGGGIW